MAYKVPNKDKDIRIVYKTKDFNGVLYESYVVDSRDNKPIFIRLERPDRIKIAEEKTHRGEFVNFTF